VCQHNDLDLLEICCWSKAMSDGALTYSLIETVQIDDPDIQITFDRLEYVENRNREFNFKNSVDDHLTVIPTAAWTQFRLTDRGLIDNVKITISDDVLNYGFDNDLVGQIAKHEMGHALGLGDSYDEERLMADRTENISKCEIGGVLQANQWKLVIMKNIPEPTSKKYVIC
jgi:hypothetical protein